MSKHLFVINDLGSKYAITDTRLEMNNEFVVDPSLYYETNKEDLYYFVKNLIISNNKVSFLKSSIEDRDLRMDDIISEPIDSLSLHKEKAYSKAKHFLKQRTDFILQFDFFQFTVLNNKFVDLGYVITDENREAKYLEIINTNDISLIGDLEVYLECRDRIHVSMHNYNNFLEFVSIVKNSSTIEGIDTAYSEFALLYS